MSETVEINLPPWSEHICLHFHDYRYIGIHGGRGSSKSHTIARILILMASREKTRVLCTREVQKSIKDSVKRLLDDVIDVMGFRSMFTSTETEIRGSNGSLFVFAGLQHNINSIKSMEGIDICWCEEAQTTSYNSLRTLIPTIRKEGSKIIFTWNPDDPKDPVDAMLRGDSLPPSAYVLEVNYKDNPWFPQELRNDMEHDKLTDYGEYLHVWEGQYRTRNNANVFQNWRIEDFTTPSDAFFRFGCDWGFSVDPTVLVRCYIDGRKIYIDQEAYRVGCEIDDTPALFATIPESDRWPIIADSASPERIAYMRKHGYPKMMKAIKGRKSIEEGIEFLRSHQIIVHPRCESVIYELSHYRYKVDPHTDEITNVLEDKDNHCIAYNASIETEEGPKQICQVTVGDRVLTRQGYQRVTRTWDQGFQKTVVITTDKGTLTCTHDHEILTDRGWLRADALGYGDGLLHIEDSQWQQKQSSGTATDTTDTQNQTDTATEATTDAPLLVGLRYFTERCGNIIMAPFLLTTIFIISMTTQLTMTFQILSVFLLKIMLNTMARIGQKRGWRSRELILSEYDLYQPLGTRLKKVELNIERLERWLIRTLSPWKSLASSVERYFFPKNSATKTSSAQTNANQRGAEIAEWMMKPAHAQSASQRLESINIPKKSVAVARVQTVKCGPNVRTFDLSVENCPEFFANCICVANCIDALRYSCEAVRRTKKKDTPKIDLTPSMHHWG